MMPPSQGAFPTFPNAATLVQKKQLISEFIERERMLIKSINENFILELKDT